MKLLMLLVVVLALLAITVDAGASDKIAQLKARVEQAPAAALPAAPKATSVPPKFKLPVKLVGVADQMPGDKEHNEILIAKADPDIAINKAKSIKEIDLRESAAAVQRATNAQDNFHQMQSVVLKEPLLPRTPL